MKKIVNVVEVENEGLASLLGEKVLLMCMNYSYSGTLEGVNETCIMLSSIDAAIVYETGDWKAAGWKDAQLLGRRCYVQLSSIESFMPGK